MKQRLLSVLALAAMTFTASAQTTWTPPALDASYGVELKSSDTDTVYLYNVGAAQFLIGGTDWGTHAALGDNGLPIRLTSNSEDAWTIYFFEGSKSQQILGRSTEADLFIDYNGQAGWCTTYTFTKVGDYYRIQSNVNDATYGQEAFPGTYIGQSPTREDIDHNGTSLGFGKGIYGNVTEDEEDAHLDWLIVSKASFQAYNSVVSAKKQLLAIINTAEENGIDAAAAIAVLNNNNATVEQIEDAGADLKTKIVASLGENASEDNPVDVTSIFVVNPDFTGKSTAGWELVKGGTTDVKTQDNNPHYIQLDDGSNTEEIGLDASPGGWLEFWKSGGIDADQDAHQVISDLPSGQYRLQLDGVGEGGLLYAITNGIEQTAPLGKYLQHVNFDFLHLGGDLTMGFKFKYVSGNTVAWVAVDNFRLYYLGQGSNPYIILLNAAVAKIEDYYNEAEGKFVSKTLLDELKQVYDNAQALIDSQSEDEAACQAAIEAVNVVAEKAAVEAAAYVRFNDFITMLDNEVEKYKGELQTKIEDLLDQYGDAYDDRAYTPEQIDAAIAAYQPMVKEYIQKDFDTAAAAGTLLSEPIDITMLFDDMSFGNSSATPTFPDGYPSAENALWQNETKTDKMKVSYGTMEVWSAGAFNVYRQFENLPKGKYTIRTHAFHRVEANIQNYDNYKADLYDYATQDYVYLYANDGKKQFVNVAELALEDPDRAAALNYTEMKEGEGEEAVSLGYWVPNSQLSARSVFTDEEMSEKSLIEASGIITDERGTLTVGVRGTDNLLDNSWSVWYGFELLYWGEDPSEYPNAVESLVAQAEAKQSDYFTTDAPAKLDAAIQLGRTTLDNASDYVAAITALREAINYVQEGQTLYNKMKEDCAAIKTRIDALMNPESGEPAVYNDQEYIAMLDLVESFDPDFNTLPESNEAIQTYIKRMADEYEAFVWSKAGLDEATAEAPVSMGEIIANGNFASASKDAWTIVNPEGADVAVETGGSWADGVAEFWNASTFDISQEVKLLKDGFWRLSADAFFRTSGDGAGEATMVKEGTPIEDNELYLYVSYPGFYKEVKIVQWSDFEKGAIMDSDELFSIVTGTFYPMSGSEETGDLVQFVAPNSRANFNTFWENGRYGNSVDFGVPAAGTTVKIGIVLKASDKNNWIPMDNFDLLYLGQTAPDAVGGIVANGTVATEQVYGIDGRVKSGLTRGINIVRTSDGAVRKVLVK